LSIKSKDPLQARLLLAAYRRCQQALAFSVAIHVAALAGMLLLLAPGIDTQVSVLERAHWVADHVGRWRAGWALWQLTALSDVLVSAALLLLCWRARRAQAWALLGLLLALLAVIPDQLGEWRFVGTQVELARGLAAGQGVRLDAYLDTESRSLLLTGTCGAAGYVLMSFSWLVTTLRFAGACAGARAFAWVGLTHLALFAVTVVANFASTRGADPWSGYPGFGLVYWGNALAFPLLCAWMLWMAALLGVGYRRLQPAEDAALHQLRPPQAGLLGLALRCAAAPGLRDLLRWSAPFFPRMQSSITDVVYLNWLVPTERAAALLPAPLRAHDLGGRSFVSLLTYRHGNFGPALLGPLRRLLPSPVQSNWRLYLEPEGEGAAHDAIYFFKTSIDSDLLCAASRLFSDGLPSQRPLEASHLRREQHVMSVLDPGAGSAPDLYAVVEECAGRELPAELEGVVGDWGETVRYLFEQNRALNVVHDAVVESRITIPIRLEDVRPARVHACESEWLSELVQGCACFAFVVPAVEFEARGESRVAPAPLRR